MPFSCPSFAISSSLTTAYLVRSYTTVQLIDRWNFNTFNPNSSQTRGLDMQVEEIEMDTEICCVVPAGDICGEGAVWHPDENVLYWTDINRFLVHRFDPASLKTE